SKHEGKKPSVCSIPPAPLNIHLSPLSIQQCALETLLSPVFSLAETEAGAIASEPMRRGRAGLSCGSVCEWTHGAAGAPIVSCLLWRHPTGGRGQESLGGPEKRRIQAALCKTTTNSR
ncbi:unnamed protein product, partial [Staurois parvus]